jgi:hypothetical protein
MLFVESNLGIAASRRPRAVSGFAAQQNVRTTTVKGIVQFRKATNHARRVSILGHEPHMRGGSAQQPGATWPGFLAYLEWTEPLSLSCGSYLDVLENPYFVQGNLLPSSEAANERPSGSVRGHQSTGVPTALKSYYVEGSSCARKFGRTEPRPNRLCAFGSLQYTLHLLLVIDCGTCDLLARRILDR